MLAEEAQMLTEPEHMSKRHVMRGCIYKMDEDEPGP